MPPVIVRGQDATTTPAVSVTNRGYDYPGGLDLRPDSSLHSQVLQKIMARAEDSFQVMQERHDSWAQIDRVMRAYIPLSKYEKELKNKGGNEGAMHAGNRPVSIMVPYSYATRDTLLTYLDEAFLAMGPPLQYMGTGPEDEIGAKLMEVLVDYQVRRMKAALGMHTAFSDGLSYGIGPSTFAWVSKWGRKAQSARLPIYGLSGDVLGYQTVRQNVDALLYEGNRLDPVDPYRYLPDPNVSAERVQDGEFVGWTHPVSLYQLMAQEKSDPGMFNVRYLRDRGTAGQLGASLSKLVPAQSGRGRDASGQAAGIRTAETHYHEVLTIFIEIIPREWGLGDLDEPEIWFFQVADDTFILRAAPIDMNHRSYPVAVAAPDSDGYSPTPISRMEIIQGLQDVLNWMFNSHVANVRKSLNDMLIVDPSMVVMGDLQNPDPGKLVRLRRSAWGRGVDGAVKQLTVQDVTRGNMGDASMVIDMMNRASGGVDALMGIMRSGGERRSAAEATSTEQNAVSRLRKMARLMGLQYMQDVGYFYASHTQQYMSQATYAKAVGSWPEVLRREYGQAGGVLVSPLDILVDFDVVYSDGTTQTSGAASADTWAQLFQTIGSNPVLMQQFDVPRIFMHVARLLGANNLWDFVRQQGQIPAIAPQVVPDQQAMDQVQAGNWAPLDQLAEAA